MAISRKLRIVVTISAGALLIIGCIFLAVEYFSHRLLESDLLWVGTRQVGGQLLIYANEHGGQFPASLEDGGLTNRFDSYAKTYIQHLRPFYIQPVTHDTNIVKMLVVDTKRETVVFYSNGNIESLPPSHHHWVRFALSDRPEAWTQLLSDLRREGIGYML